MKCKQCTRRVTGEKSVERISLLTDMEIVPYVTSSKHPKARGRSTSMPSNCKEEIKTHHKPSLSNLESLPWKDMFEGAANMSNEKEQQHRGTSDNALPEVGDSYPTKTTPKTSDSDNNAFGSQNPELRLALYIAMAHGGLIFLLAAIYGVTKLLEEYWTPIQWAILCSMPLREIQGALVDFWTQPLQLGLFETLLALPVAVYDAMAGTFNDLSHAVVRKKLKSEEDSNTKFSKLLRWMLSFAIFVLTYERLGVAAWPIFLLAGFILHAAQKTVEFTDDSNAGKMGVATTLKVISQVRRGRSLRKRGSRLPIWSRASRYVTHRVLKRLSTLIAVWLISIMIIGFVAGILFFSYKIGLEGKDAVISLKEHVQKSNYAERVGLKQWIIDNNIPELMDTYTVKFYETVSLQMDAIARQYNMTDFADSFKQYLLTPKPAHDNFSLSSVPAVPSHPFTLKLQSIRIKAQNRDFTAIYTELEALFKDIQISRDDLVVKAKNFALQSMDVIKHVFASSTVLFTGGTNFVLSVVVSIASGAAGILNFLSQSMVFFSLLYYLITSESGGVMEHVLGMLPVSKTTRSRCATVLNHAVSSVLLATAKMAFFQAAVTWLLFRFFQIHFVYMSTLLAFTSALLPIFPPWVSSLPAGLQMAVEGQYLQGVVLTIIHIWIMDYGVAAIQCDVPGQNVYLTGLSIIGGMAIFSSALEGAIMGPLILTFIMALKNLYSEFVLAAAKEMNN
ncbi:hypothetical protein SUGI_0645880 [Cryptomeria japonica]|uniref:uncharacterized protein LOC131067303 isoform X1 n=1 Tax=Cryptomeria japonica TaxID=3369 RepID=UPI002414A17C|nr:uncharacterized protein LOC131067303 isoform X1 [Cryptomeria japonica]GLJ32074.1 hypothetical protein SUGI_0645880 [Cryptomeria japonica]